MPKYEISPDHLREAQKHLDGIIVTLPSGRVPAGHAFDYAQHRVLIDVAGIDGWLRAERGDYGSAAIFISNAVSQVDELTTNSLRRPPQTFATGVPDLLLPLRTAQASPTLLST